MKHPEVKHVIFAFAAFVTAPTAHAAERFHLCESWSALVPASLSCDSYKVVKAIIDRDRYIANILASSSNIKLDEMCVNQGSGGLKTSELKYCVWNMDDADVRVFLTDELKKGQEKLGTLGVDPKIEEDK